jgi:hypothetical protein
MAPCLSIRGKWFLSSRPILSSQQRAYRRSSSDRVEALWFCLAPPEFWRLQASPPRSAARPCHSRPGDHWPSVQSGIGRFAQSQHQKACRANIVARSPSFSSPIKNHKWTQTSVAWFERDKRQRNVSHAAETVKNEGRYTVECGRPSKSNRAGCGPSRRSQPSRF